MQNSPIAWVGGKRLLRQEILKRIPDHVTYVEAFCGASWVLFGKDPERSKVEVLNDANGELTNFFRCVREKPLELVEKLRFRMVSQEDFQREKRTENCGRSEIERAAAFFWILKNSFGSKMIARSNFGYALGEKRGLRVRHIRPIIRAAHERLKHVYVFNEDFEKLITRLDRLETFFYCDPPYYGCGKCYEHDLTEADHKRLAATLRSIKGKFMLSYDDCAEIKDLYNWAHIEEVETRYSLTRNPEKRKRVKEVLIRNYEQSASSAG